MLAFGASYIRDFTVLMKFLSCACHMTYHIWWWVNTGSYDGLVPPGIMPLHQLILTQIYTAIWRHQAKMGWIKTRPPFGGLTEIAIWISNHIHYFVWDVIAQPVLNLTLMASSNGEKFRVNRTLCGEFAGALICYLICAWINGFITHTPVHISDFRGVRARYVKRTG